MPALPPDWFDGPPVAIAHRLIGRLLLRRREGLTLAARIIETEAYALADKASHSSLGRTPSREPMFAAPGTIYMYWSRGGPSLNVSVGGPGDAVLIKSAVAATDGPALAAMHALSPARSGERRPDHKLLSGQSLLCRALDLQVADWTGRPFGGDLLAVDDGYRPDAVLQTARLGIARGRDADLPWRFIDRAHVRSATKNPLTRRGAQQDRDWWLLSSGDAAVPRPPLRG